MNSEQKTEGFTSELNNTHKKYTFLQINITRLKHIKIRSRSCHMDEKSYKKAIMTESLSLVYSEIILLARFLYVSPLFSCKRYLKDK